jgi:glycosyltransferase involved in cell wall biosynthesis
MQVGLVARCLNTAHIRGMGRYVFELLNQSAGEPGLQWLTFGDDPARPLHTPPGVPLRSDVFSFRGDRFQLWEQLGLPLHSRAAGVNLLHCTEGSLPWWQPVPTVVTLHDTLAWDEHAGDATSRLYFDKLLPAALARCAAVITISDSSRRDIVAKWPALESKLTVIPHGIGDEYFSDVPGSLSAELAAAVGSAPYVVYVGGPMSRKRFDWAVQVLAASGRPDLHLVACGFGAPARASAQAALPAALRPRVHFAPFLSDAELLALYRGAGAVLYPTLYEGFGFPAVEAQAAGVPALFSAVGSLAELAGPLAFVVEPKDMPAWASALHAALDLTGPARAKRAAAARTWAQGFSWRRSFEQHLAVYRRVAAAQGLHG